MGEILGFVGQYGLPLVLLFILGYAYDRKERKHEADKERWELQLKAERTACAEERDRWNNERSEFIDRERAKSEKDQAVMIEVQKDIIRAVQQAGAVADAFAQEKKEIREQRDRELRDTGQRAPFVRPQGTPQR